MSDQDFFFDEDEQPKTEKAEPAKKAGTSRPAAKTVSVSSAPAAQSVSMTIAALIGVIALLAGLIIGILLPIGGTQTATPTVGTSPAGSTAPQLTNEQMQSGQLPQGHPDISSMGGGSTGTSGSAETTGK